MSAPARRATSRPRILLLLLAAVTAVGLGGCFGSSHKPKPKPPPAPKPPLAATPPFTLPGTKPASHHPNIIFVLTDDLSMDLLRYLPAVRAMQRHGMTFNDYFVSDSLCCPSRASIFTGDFPHDSGIFNNTGPDGGFQTFFNRGDQFHTFNLALQQAGYATAMMGKYLNGYLQPRLTSVPGTYIPPGWNEWDVAGFAYSEFNYRLNEDGVLHYYGDQPQDYLTDVIAKRGVQFIDREAQAGRPFFMEMATFAPHRPYTPAPRDANDFPGLTVPEPPNFNAKEINPPRWLSGHPPLTAAQILKIDRVFQLRAQSVQAVSDMINRLEGALAANHVSKNTYIVFSSDNGLHTGEYRLLPGKLTAFDTDIHVPLVVVGPGVPAGRHSNAMLENIDLAKTFSAIGGTTLPSDGHNMLPLWQGQPARNWRNAILVEHHGPDANIYDPDAQNRNSGNPTSYEAVRTPSFLFVQYADGELEYHDLATDPFEIDNQANQLSPGQLELLHVILARLEDCHTGPSCWTAGHVAPVLVDRLGRAGG